MSERTIRTLLIVAAVIHLANGVWQFFAPGHFYETVATFGARNDHFIRDISTVFIALGIALWIAAGRLSWRPAVLAVAVIQYTVHLISHIVDVQMARPESLGWITIVLLAGPLALFVVLLRRSSGPDTGSRPPAEPPAGRDLA